MERQSDVLEQNLQIVILMDEYFYFIKIVQLVRDIIFLLPPLICPVRVLSSGGAGNYNTIHCGKLPVFKQKLQESSDN